MDTDLRTLSLEAFLNSDGVRTGANETKKFLDEVGEAAKKKLGDDFEDGSNRAMNSLEQLGHSAVNTFLYSWMNLNTLLDGMRELNELTEEGIELQRRRTEEAARFQKQNMELAGIVGEVPNKDFLLKQLELQIATGATAAQASDFMTGFTNEGQLAIGKNIDEDEARIYQEMMLRFMVSRNLPNAERVGTVAGAMLRKGDFNGPGGSQKAFDETAQAVEVLNVGSGDLNKILRQSNQVWQMLGNEDEMKGQFRSFGEAAFAVSLAAQANDAKAWTFINQANRALRGFNGPFGSTLEEAGIDPKDGFIESIAKFSQWANKTSAAEKTPLDLLLRERGLDDKEAITALTGMASNFQLETTQEQLALLRKDPAGFGVDARAQMDKFDAEVGVNLQARQANEASKVRQGIEGFDLERNRNLAEADLRQRGLLDSDRAHFGEWITSALSWGTVSRDQVRQDVIDRRAAELMSSDAMAAGLQRFTAPKFGEFEMQQFPSIFSNMSPDDRAEIAAQLSQLIALQKEQLALQKQMMQNQPPGRNVPPALPSSPRSGTSSSSWD